MKYRIVEQPYLFIPQYRRFFLWRNFYEKRQFGGFLYSSIKAFSSLEGARKFLDEQINKKAAKQKPVIYPH